MTADDELWPPRPKKPRPTLREQTATGPDATELGSQNTENRAKDKSPNSTAHGNSGLRTEGFTRDRRSTDESDSLDESWPPLKQRNKRETTYPLKRERKPANSSLSEKHGPDSDGDGGSSSVDDEFASANTSRPVRINFFRAIIRAFSKYADFTGRSTRAEYWWFILFFLLAGAVAALDDTLFSLYFLGTLLPNLAVTTRRLRDAGIRWGWMFTLLVPPVGLIAIAILASLPSRGGAEFDRPEGLHHPSSEPKDRTGRIPPIAVDPTPPSPLQRTEMLWISVLAFLFSWVGLFARYLYLDSRQVWRNRHRIGEFASISSLLVLTTVGLGFLLTSYRWWAHSGEDQFKKIAWAGFGPILSFTLLGPIYAALVPGTPIANPASIPFAFIALFALSIWNFTTATTTPRRLI